MYFLTFWVNFSAINYSTRGGDIMKRIIKFGVFLVLSGVFYLLTTWSFSAIAFLLAYLFMYSTSSGALLFLAKEFDKNHNNLADVVGRLESEIERLSSEYDDLQSKYDDLKDELNSIKSNSEPKGLEPFYDYMDEIEQDKKAP